MFVVALASALAFSPTAPFAVRPLAPPLKVALSVAPTELPPSGTKLDEFLQLLGRCYACAGIAHAADFATANALPAASGLLPFSQQSATGQALGVVWCLLGVVQLISNDRAQQQGLLAAYGVYEIVCTLAASTVSADPEGAPLRLSAAAGLQAIVAYCYFELRRQSLEAAALDRGPAIARRGGRRGGDGSRMSLKQKPELPEPPKSFQEQLEKRFGKDLFRAIVILTGVCCYPLMLLGAINKPH